MTIAANAHMIARDGSLQFCVQEDVWQRKAFFSTQAAEAAAAEAAAAEAAASSRKTMLFGLRKSLFTPTGAKEK